MLGLSGASPLVAEPVDIAVSARLISQFRIGQDVATFGRLTFVGGLELTGRSRQFGSFSAFRFLSPGERFIGVADTGYWYFGTVERDANGRPTGFSDFSMEPITGPDGEPTSDKSRTDAEGLAVADGIATVGFERIHRLSQYRIERGRMGAQLRNLDFLIPRNELRLNRSLETVLAAPKSGPFGGAIITVSEKSLNPAGDIFAAVLSGPRKGVFFVRRTDDFDVTDGAFLPDGDILLLERRFSYAAGVAMRLRLVAARDVTPGATVDGEVLLTAEMGYQIDNMEGLDVWRAPDGSTRLSMISDDNQSILQRNIYLEFLLRNR